MIPVTQEAETEGGKLEASLGNLVRSYFEIFKNLLYLIQHIKNIISANNQ